jgi:hypothetical protein
VIYITDTGTSVLTDPSQPPYDGSDDTLVGVVNDSSGTVGSVSLTSNTGAFGFDGDGICSGAFGAWDGSSGCPYGATGYEGPNTSYANVSSDGNNGTVEFGDPLGAGGSTYFSLEAALS